MINGLYARMEPRANQPCYHRNDGELRTSDEYRGCNFAFGRGG